MSLSLESAAIVTNQTRPSQRIQLHTGVSAVIVQNQTLNPATKRTSLVSSPAPRAKFRVSPNF